MKTLRFLRLDVREGFASAFPGLVAATLLCLILMGLLMARASRAASGDLSNFTTGDYMAAVCGGMGVYRPEERLPFVLPVGWMLAMLLMLYGPLRYPYRDLMGFGRVVMIASGGRGRWWASKCIWLLLYAGVFWVLLIACAYIMTVISGGRPCMSLTDAASSLLGFDTWNLVDGCRSLLPFIGVAFLMSYALVLVQFALSLALRPVMSYAFQAALLFTSAFFFHPFLPGEYLMAARGSWVIVDGAPFCSGVVLALALVVLSWLLGYRVFRKMDIVGKEFAS